MLALPTLLRRAEGLKFTFRALRYRNYRLFFFGQGFSLIGTWMQMIAMSWLVYALTKDPRFLGYVGFMGQIPTFLLGAFLGVLVDRWNRHRTLVVTQTLAMIQAFVLAALVLTHTIAPWHLLILSLYMGFVNALDIPTRQSFVVDLVDDKADLVNAIALNSSMFNGARLVGPSIAGVLIPIVGEGLCFLSNGISYIAVIIALLMMRIPAKAASQPVAEVPPLPPSPLAAGPDTTETPVEPTNPITTMLHELREGVAYAYHSPPIKYSLVLLGFLSLLAMPFGVLMPMVVKELLHGNASVFGGLMAVSGIGALGGALYLAGRKAARGLERLMAVGPAVFGVALMAFSRSHIVWLSGGLILVAGFGMMVQIASTNTVIQTVVEDDKRGRVMSLYSVVFMGTAPFGSLIAGLLASKIGAGDTLLLNGACALIASLLFLLRLPAMTNSLNAHYATVGLMPPPTPESPMPAGGD